MDTRKGLAALGSTGSVGVNTLDVVTSHPTKIVVRALAAHSNVDLLEEQTHRFRPRLVALFDEEKAAAAAPSARSLMSRSILVLRAYAVPQRTTASRWSCPRWSALSVSFPHHTRRARQHSVALANKETLVMAGELVMRPSNRRGAALSLSIANTMRFFKPCMAMNAPRCGASY
jgi:1-deoxy-D-xylulose-5-phosphate reductoisomerase